MKKARVLVFDGKKFFEAECGELDDYYKYLECDCFDIANRSVGGSRYDIFVDDIWLFKDEPQVCRTRILSVSSLLWWSGSRAVARFCTVS